MTIDWLWLFIGIAIAIFIFPMVMSWVAGRNSANSD